MVPFMWLEGIAEELGREMQYLFCAAFSVVLWENMVGYIWLQNRKGPRANGTVRVLIWWRA